MSTAPDITAPVFEHHHSGLGVNTSRPRISWAFKPTSTSSNGWVQSAYEIEVTPGYGNTPQTFRVESDQSVLVPWPSEPLASRASATVRVRVSGHGSDSVSGTSSWSTPTTVEAAFLDPSDFKASFITSAQRIGPYGPLQPIRFRKEFTTPESTSRARLYITSLGVFEARINGKLVSDEHLAPGWTSYRFRLAYRILDVTDLLLPAGQKNVICAEVGEGWYAGRLGFLGGERFRYGDELGLFAQLEVQSAGGADTTWSLLTDDTWTAAPGPYLSSEIYDGEVYDAGLDEPDTWATVGASWPGEIGTGVLSWPKGKLVAPDAGPVRVTETLSSPDVFTSKSGKTILDFRQNLVGKLLIPSLTLAKGEKVTFRHAEVMENGELGTRPLRKAKCEDTIIGSGATLKDWTPRFTFHGFRYVQVDGWPADDTSSLKNIQALVMHTDMKRRGFFECSNQHVNRLHSNVVWSMRGNFLSLPTDCPQRDERLGWTGDLQVFCPTASFLYDTMGILGNWLEDLSAEQLEEGKGSIPPLVCPIAIAPNWPHIAQAVWDDVVTLVPDVLYQYSSDKNLLERQFGSMQAWLDEGVDRAPDGLWNPDKWQLSDWLDPIAPPEDPGAGRTDGILVANAYLIHTTLVFARLCGVLGKDDLEKKYTADGERLKALFQRRYITAEGNIMSSSQTGIALTVRFNLYPESEEQRQTAATALDRLIRYARFNIATGFAGTPVICHALTEIGKPQLAYRMLLETRCPSWLYAVSMGATTIWERWDSMLTDGRINPGEMTSFNHYALGSVADWLHGSVGGISPLDAGWKRIKVRPVPGGNLTSAKAAFDGPYGRVVCEWEVTAEGGFKMTVTVPPNSSAVVTLPSELRDAYFTSEKEEPSRTVGSGTHTFECQFNPGEWPPKPLISANKSMPPDTIAE